MFFYTIFLQGRNKNACIYAPIPEAVHHQVGHHFIYN